MMERPTVPAAMLAAFGGTDGDLAARLLAALFAAEGEGGDVRGRQSAALVVAPGPGDGSTPQPWARRFDVRVEDHRSPVDELARVLSVARAYEAMDEAEAAGRPRRHGGRGGGERAIEGTWRPTTTRSCCGTPSAWRWRAAWTRRAPSSARATEVEPRAGEHLRRFAEQGHLPGGDAVLRALGLR